MDGEEDGWRRCVPGVDGEGVSLVWMDRRMDRDEVEKEGRDQTFRTLCSGSDNG